MPTNFRTPESLNDWMRQIEKRLQRQERRLGVSAKGTVTEGGNPTTITASSSWFINTDTIQVAEDGPGDFTLQLTHVPRTGSEHVYWGPLWVPPTTWSRIGTLLTVHDDLGDIKVDDWLSCSYAYDPSVPVQQPPAPLLPEPVVIGSVNGVSDYPTKTITYSIPPGTQAGDLIVVAARAGGAPGGGDTIDAVSCSDVRMTQQFSSAIHPMAVWTGEADGTSIPVVVDFTPDPGLTGGGIGVLTVLRGVHGVGSVLVQEATTTTPQIAGTAAVAVTWDGNFSFTPLSATPPTGFTDMQSTGFGYTAVDISYWHDDTATVSPPGSFTDQGCVVMQLF